MSVFPTGATARQTTPGARHLLVPERAMVGVITMSAMAKYVAVLCVIGFYVKKYRLAAEDDGPTGQEDSILAKAV